MTKFRFHYGGLAESMASLVDVGTVDDLVAVVAEANGWALVDDFGCHHLRGRPYRLSPDPRIDWTETHVVQVRGFIDRPDDWTVIGFSDSPIAGLVQERR